MKLLSFLSEGFSFAVQAINSYRSRAFLTVMGVAIGIFVITGIRSMVNSMESSITKNLSALGSTTMFVHNWPWKDNSEDWFKYLGRPKVSYEDYVKVKNNLPYAEGVYYEASFGGQTAKREGRSISSIRVIGATEDMNMIKDLDLREGRPISQVEFFRGANVCMLGYNVYKGLFEDGYATGKTVRIRGSRLTVVGVINRRGINIGPSEDDAVYVPYRTASHMYNLNRRGVEKMMTVKAVSTEKMDYVESELIGLMRASRGLRPTAEDNFSINKQEMLISQVNSIFSTLRGAGDLISAFSILVGLFSIGLIMYITVRERTKEIGIQKSLGASKGFILYQFLVEAVIVCVIGGAIGMVGVYGLTEYVQHLVEQNDLPFTIRVTQSEISFGTLITLVMGLLAGSIPAYLASSVDPVVALRFK
jgi:putative ABC transport system permease protein